MQAAEAHGRRAAARAASPASSAAATAPVIGVEVDGEIARGATRSSSPWGRGRSWLRDGCRCRRCSGSRATASSSTRARRVPAEALFLEYQEADGAVHSPEVFPRADGTTYVCAISSESPLAGRPCRCGARSRARIERLQAMCSRLSPGARGRRRSLRRAGLLPAGHAGRPAADRPGAGVAGRLRRHRPQRLGHPQCAGHRRGDGGADRRRRGAHGRPCSVRPRSTATR